MQNRHPADRLADAPGLRSRDWRPKRRKLRAYLLEHPHDRIGEEHIAVIGSQSRKRVDLKGLADEVGASLLQRFHHLQVSHGCAAATAGSGVMLQRPSSRRQRRAQ